MKLFSFLLILTSLISFSLYAQDTTSKVIPDTENFKPTLDLEPNLEAMPHRNTVQTNKEGIALDGFDTVAYFTQEQAVKGSSEFSCEYQNTTWYFSSAENRDAFLANPEKFAPQYGGYCAHSLTNNKLVRSNPESFSIRDDKLYLYVNDRVAVKDVEKEENIFANHDKSRKKNWFKFESKF